MVKYTSKWNKYNNDDNNCCYICCKRFEIFLKSIYNKRKMLLPISAHLMDQATDIGTIIEFYFLYKYNNINNCKSKYHLNTFAFFIIV